MPWLVPDAILRRRWDTVRLFHRCWEETEKQQLPEQPNLLSLNSIPFLKQNLELVKRLSACLVADDKHGVGYVQVS